MSDASFYVLDVILTYYHNYFTALEANFLAVKYALRNNDVMRKFTSTMIENWLSDQYKNIARSDSSVNISFLLTTISQTPPPPKIFHILESETPSSYSSYSGVPVTASTNSSLSSGADTDSAVSDSGSMALSVSGSGLVFSGSVSDSGDAGDTENGNANFNTVALVFPVYAETHYGENIYLAGSLNALGNWSPNNALLLSSARYPLWTIKVVLPANTSFKFKYLRKNNHGEVTWEPGRNRSATTPGKGITYAVSAATVYGEHIHYRSITAAIPNIVAVTFVVSVETAYEENIYLTGSEDILGIWSPVKAILLSSARPNTWNVTVYLPASTSFTYKYLRKYDGTVKEWESDPDRLHTTPATSGSYILNDIWR